MNIYLTDISTGNKLTLPMLPETIKVEYGSAMTSFDIADVGNVDIPYGEELTSIAWSGMFPSRKRAGEPYIVSAQDPKAIEQWLNEMRKGKKKLNLLITDTAINHAVYLKSLTTRYEGGAGDYTYDISFVQAKDVIVKTEATNVVKPSFPRPNPKPVQRTYTVRPNDYLWLIAEKCLGNGRRYPEIYNLNKAMIDAHNAGTGYPRYTIYAGQVFVIPDS